MITKARFPRSRLCSNAQKRHVYLVGLADQLPCERLEVGWTTGEMSTQHLMRCLCNPRSWTWRFSTKGSPGKLLRLHNAFKSVSLQSQKWPALQACHCSTISTLLGTGRIEVSKPLLLHSFASSDGVGVYAIVDEKCSLAPAAYVHQNRASPFVTADSGCITGNLFGGNQSRPFQSQRKSSFAGNF